jgi:hypothetical protein
MRRRKFTTETQRHKGFLSQNGVLLCALVSLWFASSPQLEAATHVTATYDLGANPHVMATVNGHEEYGLVFAQRNKLVTYNGVEYGPSVVKGYLDASGQLNDGAGNLWLDLIPNLGASPGDSYYVVTFNIQGQVHAEIWVVPDTTTVGAEVCQQSQAPSSGAAAVYYQFLQQVGEDLPQRPKLNLTGSGVSCVDNAGELRTDCTIAGGGGGGSAPIASPSVSGTVKIDAADPDPVVYLKSSADTLLAGKASSVHTHSENDVTNLTTDLAGKAPLTHSHAESDVTNLIADLAAKVPTSRSVSTSSPLSGGGVLSSDLALACPTCEVSGNKNAANGYAGLDGSLKLAGAQIPYGTSANTAAQGNDSRITGAEQTANKNAASGYAGLTASSKLNLSQMQEVLASADLSDLGGLFGTSPGTKAVTTALAGDPTADNCVKWIAGGKLGDAGQACGTGGGGGDNISVNSTAATNADFDDSTPAAPANSLNVKWQKDASAPDNISAYVPWAQGTITSSTPIINHTAEWNSGGTTFTNIFSNVTDTASASGSLLMDLQVGGSSKFKVRKDGMVLMGIGNFTVHDPNDLTKANAFDLSGITASTTRTTTVPDADTVLVQPYAGGSNQFVTDISTSGVVGHAQPSAANLSDGTTGSGAVVLATGPTNVSLNAEGSGNTITLVSKINMDVAGCDNASAAAAWDLPTSGAAGKACLGTGPRFGVLTFADAATSGAFTHLRLPSDWTGNIDLVLLYTGDTSSGNNIVWQPAEACVADGEGLLAPSFTTTTSATGAGPATAGQRKSLTFSNMTMTGCAAGETMFLRVQRLGSDGSDTYAGTAQLLEVEMTLRRAQ